MRKEREEGGERRISDMFEWGGLYIEMKEEKRDGQKSTHNYVFIQTSKVHT